MIEQPQGILSQEQCEDIFKRCAAMANGDNVAVEVSSSIGGETKWARNRAYVSESSQWFSVRIDRFKRRQRGIVFLDSYSDAALRSGMDQAKLAMEFDSKMGRSLIDINDEHLPQHPILHPKLWSDATVAFDGAKRSEAVRQIVDRAESAKMVASGSLWVRTASHAALSTTGVARYYSTTNVEFTASARDAKGTASGWAGTNDYDVTRIDIQALGDRALQKAISGQNPVAIEPGRYTAILEPQAVADLFWPVITDGTNMDRFNAETMKGVFALRPGKSKIGMKLFDSRITVSSNPMDELGGFLPFTHDGTPHQPTKWIDQGYLRQLPYPWFYALSNFGTQVGVPMSYSWRMEGGPTSTEEMIATTKRGVLITRLFGVDFTDAQSGTCSGYTRDGVWLIQDGKISKPVKNFRFTESPLLSFNRVEQIGPVARVLPKFQRSNTVVVAPTLKVLDFNLTQLADAV